MLAVTETLRMAMMGLTDLQSDDHERRLPGLRNAIVYGHATTQTLQGLRSAVPTFDTWYEPIREDMRADQLMRFFWDLRSEILKEGALSGLVQERKFESTTGGGILSNAPPNAIGIALPDETGRPGWLVEDQDGNQTVQRADWDSGTTVTHLFEFVNAPTTHQGSALPDRSVVTLTTLYLDYLRRIIDDARARFGENAPAQQSPPPAP
jgi:hypothetical protein